MSQRKNLNLPGVRFAVFLLVVFITVSNCARFRGAAVKPVERAGVKAWVVAPGAHPTQGPMARARAGDLALSDGDIIVVVSQAARGGHWVDVARTADKGYDYLGEIVPVYDKDHTSTYAIDAVEITGDGPEAPPAIQLRGHDPRRPRLEITTRLDIQPSSHAVVLTTHLRNGTSETLAPLQLGDRIWWGADNVFLPYHGNLQRPSGIETSGTWLTWLCSWQDNFTLGVVAPEGSIWVRFGKQDATLVYREARLDPGGELTYRRYFPVRDKQIASVSEFAWRLRGHTMGRLEGRVEETINGKPVGDCRVEVVSELRGAAASKPTPLTWVYTDDNGRFRAALPVGRHYAWTEKVVGRRGPGVGINYDITTGTTTQIKQVLQVSPQVMLNYEVRDADTSGLLPCKITFVPYPDVPAVDFGPEWSGPGARDSYLSATGQGSFSISAGRYRAIVSRGPEYDAQVAELMVGFSTQNRLAVSLKRVIRPRDIGMDDCISMDLGVRTSASDDCRVSPRDRVTAAAAEGVECLVSGDVGAATDLSQAIKDAGLEKWVSAICGRRIEWRGAQASGEMLVFPTPPGPIAPTQLRSESEARSPDRLIQAIRRANPGSLLSVCRPLDGARGYLATQQFSIDLKRPLPALPRGAMGFNLFEILSSGERSPLTNHRMYARLLREVGRYGPSAGSDSHYLRGEECGYPRLYVTRSPKAGASLFEQIREGLTSGSVLVTNGPFIRLLVNGKPPGSFITDRDGLLDILLEVYAPAWVDVRSVMVYDGEYFAYQALLPPSTSLRRCPRSDTASPEFTIPLSPSISGPLKHDVIITATAVGQSTLGPILAQDDLRGFSAYPFAMTGPIFVDVDGDGKCTPPNPEARRPGAETF
jgi:hypothetical protein